VESDIGIDVNVSTGDGVETGAFVTIAVTVGPKVCPTPQALRMKEHAVAINRNLFIFNSPPGLSHISRKKKRDFAPQRTPR
jgi:hypothetical protein